MSFFSKYNGSTDTRHLRVERLTWVLIYGGLLTAVLGTFMGNTDEQSAVMLQTGGGIAVAIGVVLIYIRSRMGDSPVRHLHFTSAHTGPCHDTHDSTTV